MSDDLVRELRFWNGGYRSDEKMKRAADRIEKLEAALREIAKTVTIKDENWHPSYHDFSFTQTQVEGLSEALAARLMIARKALEGKDD